MPHCEIEYSEPLAAEVSPSKLLNAVLQGAVNSDLFETDDIKTRAIAFNHYLTGKTAQEFVHVTAKILSGRNVEQRSRLAQSILSELNPLFLSPVSLTIEVVEMEKTSYAKVIKSI